MSSCKPSIPIYDPSQGTLMAASKSVCALQQGMYTPLPHFSETCATDSLIQALGDVYLQLHMWTNQTVSQVGSEPTLAQMAMFPGTIMWVVVKIMVSFWIPVICVSLEVEHARHTNGLLQIHSSVWKAYVADGQLLMSCRVFTSVLTLLQATSQADKQTFIRFMWM